MFNFKNLTVEEKQTILEHLEDLRKSLLISVVAIVIAAIAAFYFSDQILAIIQQPLKSLGLDLVFIGVTEGFYIKLKLAFYGGLVLAFPVIVWQIYRFIAPALFPKERKYFLILFPVMILLFVGGALFAYFVILKLVIGFLIMIAGDLEPMLTVDKYVSFVLAFTIPFGLVFELPVIVYFLTRMGIVSPEWLSAKRKYALLGIFIMAAVLTPGPDPISQCLMGIPVYLLYETSIWVSKLSRPKQQDDESEEDS
ncbi:MAG: twin-arginine translocase subunit TatC [Syntrophomonadales bacterium]|jgi:sec-independent protein translocase protein TatC